MRSASEILACTARQRDGDGQSCAGQIFTYERTVTLYRVGRQSVLLFPFFFVEVFLRCQEVRKLFVITLTIELRHDFKKNVTTTATTMSSSARSRAGKFQKAKRGGMPALYYHTWIQNT